MVNELAGMNVKVCIRELSDPVLSFGINARSSADAAGILKVAPML